jgi:hypothetical protein
MTTETMKIARMAAGTIVAELDHIIAGQFAGAADRQRKLKGAVELCDTVKTALKAELAHSGK